MNPEDEVPESVRSTLEAMNGTKKDGYGLVGRIIMFVAVVGIGSAAAFGIWINFAIGASMTAGSGGNGSLLGYIPLLWIAGVIVATVMIFKK